MSAPRHRDLVALEAKPDAKDRELLAVSKELAKVQHKLRVAHALIDLQKKAHEILGLALPEFDGVI